MRRLMAVWLGLAAIRGLAAPALAGGDTVLVDLGTGSGVVLAMLRPLASKAIGVDRSGDMLVEAARVMQRAGLEPSVFVEADAEDLPLDDDSADLVVMRNVLHYLHDPATTFSEIRRVLKPSGELLIAESVSPTSRTLCWWRETLLAKNPERNPALTFTATGLSAFIGQHGLRITARRTVATRLSVQDWLSRPTVDPFLREQLLDRFRNAPHAVRVDHRIQVGLSPLQRSVSALRTSAVLTARWLA
jgi:SAM-dependent methyltransferase